MAYNPVFQGFSVLPRKILLTDAPIFSSFDKTVSDPSGSGYELAETSSTSSTSSGDGSLSLAGPWRISYNSSEYVRQSFLIETEKMRGRGAYSASSPSTRVRTVSTLEFGALLYTLDDAEVDQPWKFASMCAFDLNISTGDNPVSPEIKFRHSTDDILVPTSLSGYNPIDESFYTVKYPGLISKIEFAWHWNVSNLFSTVVALALEVELEKLWLNVRGAR